MKHVWFTSERTLCHLAAHFLGALFLCYTNWGSCIAIIEWLNAWDMMIATYFHGRRQSLPPHNRPIAATETAGLS